MTETIHFLTPEQWLETVFSAQAVNKGGVIRRSLRDVERLCGRDRFLKELRRRGFLAVLNAGQVVIFCNREPIVPFEGQVVPAPDPGGAIHP